MQSKFQGNTFEYFLDNGTKITVVQPMLFTDEDKHGADDPEALSHQDNTLEGWQVHSGALHLFYVLWKELGHAGQLSNPAITGVFRSLWQHFNPSISWGRALDAAWRYYEPTSADRGVK